MRIRSFFPGESTNYHVLAAVCFGASLACFAYSPILRIGIAALCALSLTLAKFKKKEELNKHYLKEEGKQLENILKFAIFTICQNENLKHINQEMISACNLLRYNLVYSFKNKEAAEKLFSIFKEGVFLLAKCKEDSLPSHNKDKELLPELEAAVENSLYLLNFGNHYKIAIVIETSRFLINRTNVYLGSLSQPLIKEKVEDISLSAFAHAIGR